jgi:hypothetical protein
MHDLVNMGNMIVLAYSSQVATRLPLRASLAPPTLSVQADTGRDRSRSFLVPIECGRNFRTAPVRHGREAERGNSRNRSRREFGAVSLAAGLAVVAGAGAAEAVARGMKRAVEERDQLVQSMTAPHAQAKKIDARLETNGRTLDV